MHMCLTCFTWGYMVQATKQSGCYHPYKQFVNGQQLSCLASPVLTMKKGQLLSWLSAVATMKQGCKITQISEGLSITQLRYEVYSQPTQIDLVELDIHTIISAVHGRVSRSFNVPQPPSSLHRDCYRNL